MSNPLEVLAAARAYRDAFNLRETWRREHPGLHSDNLCEAHRGGTDYNENMTRRALAHIARELVVACVRCGQPVEAVRECYAHPMCYACLPPPDSLPVVPAPRSV